MTTPGLADALTALREVMAEERRAIARLDVVVLEDLTARKHALVTALAELMPARPPRDPALRRLITTARVELGANAALLAAAHEAVAAALGVEPPTVYGRAARAYSTTRPLRVVAV